MNGLQLTQTNSSQSQNCREDSHIPIQRGMTGTRINRRQIGNQPGDDQDQRPHCRRTDRRHDQNQQEPNRQRMGTKNPPMQRGMTAMARQQHMETGPVPYRAHGTINRRSLRVLRAIGTIRQRTTPGSNPTRPRELQQQARSVPRKRCAKQPTAR